MKHEIQHKVKDAFVKLDFLNKLRVLVSQIDYSYVNGAKTWVGCNGDVEEYTTIENKIKNLRKSCVKEIDAHINSFQKIIDSAD